MSDFSSSEEIKRTRKSHRCFCCESEIPAGSSALKMTGVWEGDFYCEWIHSDCKEAADALNALSGNWGEDFVWLHQMEEFEDARFILKEFPEVAARLAICDRVAKIDAETD